mgnify:CR=1 FL=1
MKVMENQRNCTKPHDESKKMCTGCGWAPKEKPQVKHEEEKMKEKEKEKENEDEKKEVKDEKVNNSTSDSLEPNES